jgi:hypothetical protein
MLLFERAFVRTMWLSGGQDNRIKLECYIQMAFIACKSELRNNVF